MRKLLASGVIAAALALPAQALADTTYCVPSTAIAGCPAGATPEGTISAALAAVNADGAVQHDTLRIGPGLFVEAGLVDQANHRVDIVGEGASATTVQGTSGTTLTLSEPSSTVTGLTVRVPDGSGGSGLSLAGSADGVNVTAAAADTSITGVVIGAGTFSHGTITLPLGSTTGALGSGSGTLSDSAVTAGTGVNAVGTVQRDHITATVGFSTGSVALGLDTLDDVLILTAPSALGAEAGIQVLAGIVGVGGNVTARHVTVIGDGSGSSAGVSVVAPAGIVIPSSANATVTNSIVRGFANSLVVEGLGGALMNSYGVASMTIDHSDYDPNTTLTESQPGTCGTSLCNGTGTLTQGAHSVNVDPRFVSASDFHLTLQSPLIDTGDTAAPAVGEPATDLDGNPRVVDGLNHGTAITDLGAYEFQAHAPTVTVSASAPSVQLGTPVTFTGAASDPDPGDSVVTLSWRTDDGATGTGPSFAHAFASAGVHSATLTATDSTGRAGSAVVNVAVVPPPPAITSLAISPRSFRPAPRGATIARVPAVAGGGATVSYVDSQASNLAITVLRAVPGVRRGTSCVAPPRRRPKGRALARCTRYLAVGRPVTRVDRAGANRFRFTGRVGGRALAPGAYRLQLQPSSAGGTGAAVAVSFTILR